MNDPFGFQKAINLDAITEENIDLVARGLGITVLTAESAEDIDNWPSFESLFGRSEDRDEPYQNGSHVFETGWELNSIEQGADDDPSPYDGTYSED